MPPETPETGPGKELEGEYQEPVVVAGEPEADGAPDPVREDKRWGVFGRRS